jgi:hypothetical protein
MWDRVRREAQYQLAEAARGWPDRVTEANRRRAQKRAQALMRRVLTRHQWRSWVKVHRFRVRGSAGGYYRINRAYSENVELINRRGKTLARLCAGPSPYDADNPRLLLPIEDLVTGQALHIATDEIGWLKTANKSFGVWPDHYRRRG